MLLQELQNNFVCAGYHTVAIDIPGIYVYLLEQDTTAYLSVLLDMERLHDITSEIYEEILRGVRRTFYDYQFEEVKELAILCTPHPEEVKELISCFGEHWVLDTTTRQLLIYEGQVNQYLNVKQIIETTLDGQKIVVESGRMQKSFRQIVTSSLCNTCLVLVTIAVFLGVELTGSSLDSEHMISWGAMYFPYVLERGEYYRLFTSVFLHFGIEHLLNNMLMLLILGNYLERHMGAVKYMIFYLVTGVLANVASMIYNVSEYNLVVSAGASGAIFAVVGGLLGVILKNKGKLEDLSIGKMIFISGLSLYGGLSTQGVDNIAHLSGFIVGFCLSMFLYAVPKKEETL